MVALCDVDLRALEAAQRLYPDAVAYRNYRQLLERKDENIDAVIVSTPDHSHAPVALEAIERGKHCFCQKPLANSVAAVRRLAAAATASPVATQVGIQGLFHVRAEAAMSVIRNGLLGEVRKIHAWSAWPAETWPQQKSRLGEAEVNPAVEAGESPPWLDWDLWLGPAEWRPYRDDLHPGSWRGWHDFGTGVLGDIGSHTLALSVRTLGLAPPVHVEGTWKESGPDLFPSRERLVLNLPRHGGGEPVKVHWYDGGATPDPKIFDGMRLDDHGALLMGTEGCLYLPGCLNRYPYLLPRERFAGHDIFHDADEPVPDVYEEWISACENGSETTCGFDGFVSALTEILLVGNLCTRLGGDIRWSSSTMTVPGCEEADHLVAPRGRDW